MKLYSPMAYLAVSFLFDHLWPMTTLVFPDVSESEHLKFFLYAVFSLNIVKFLPVMRGVVLIRNLPYGFFEAELWQYFEQFGKLNRLKLFRSKKTGRSKGYAMIEFANSEVAKVAAGTMDNYLMFDHILKCEVLPPEKVRNEAFRNWFRRPSGHYANKKTVKKQNSVKSPINVKNMQHDVNSGNFTKSVF
ncbi:MKI67 FHA domain-interacting nucleolar phosphoprotein [Trichinella pseudospiralis]